MIIAIINFRNNTIRLEAIEEQRRAVNSRLEIQVFHTRTHVAPSILQLHPFDQQIAVAGKDSFAYVNYLCILCVS